MKKIITCLIALSLILTLTACGGGGKKTEADLDALASELTASAAFSMDMGQYAMQAELAAPTYGYDAASVTNVKFFYNNGTAEEIFLAQAADENAAASLEQLCKDRVANQQTVLESYNPDAIPRLQSAVIARSGVYVVLVVANDAAAAKTIVDKYVK